MIFSKNTTKLVCIQKIWKFIAAFGRYTQKRQKNCNFGQKWPNFDHFWPKFPFFGLFDLYLPNAAINFHNFYMETSLVVFFVKIIFYMPWKLWCVQNLAVLAKIWPFWAKIAIFWYFWPISSKRHYKFS